MLLGNVESTFIGVAFHGHRKPINLNGSEADADVSPQGHVEHRVFILHVRRHLVHVLRVDHLARHLGAHVDQRGVVALLREPTHLRLPQLDLLPRHPHPPRPVAELRAVVPVLELHHQLHVRVQLGSPSGRVVAAHFQLREANLADVDVGQAGVEEGYERHRHDHDHEEQHERAHEGACAASDTARPCSGLL